MSSAKNQNKRYAWTVVNQLEISLMDGTSNLDAIPKIVIKIIDQDMWRAFWCEPSYKEVHYDSFEQFVTSDLPEGLGVEMRTLKNLCRDNPAALEAIDRATQRPHGGDHSKIDNIQDGKAPTGTSREAALRRLRKDRPDLLEKVIAGKVSANAAMIEAGFRKKLSADEQAIKAIRKAENLVVIGKALVERMEPVQIEAFIELIEEMRMCK